MSKWWFAASLLLLTLCVTSRAHAQLNPLQSHGAPTGACTGSLTDVDVDTGNFYTCKPPNWGLAGGGSGSGIPYGTGGGTAQAQTVTTTPNITSLTTGTFVTWLPIAANTAAAPTLAAGTTAATAITKCGTVALVPGDLLSTVWAVAQYDGTEWVLQNPVQFGCSEGGLPTTGGTANAPTLTVAPAITAYSAGMVFNFTNGAANTGATTIAVSGLAAKSITKCGTTALVANDLTVAATAVILYDGTEFQLLNPQATGCGVTPSAATYFHTSGYFTGAVSVGTANHTICGGLIIPPGGLSVGHIAFNVGAGDGGGASRSDVGIYNGSGTLVAHVGAQVLNTTGNVQLAFSGGTQTIPAGRAYGCYTSTSTTFDILGSANSANFLQIQDISVTSSGGALNGSFTPPADNPVSQSNDAEISVILYP